ncbi:hypothetical protein [Gramella sp. AN32]|uniref:Uncharacterized protein n=1 Tax=Christiangramia antarctica TaxID=2058158 RepID=A0ABW5X0M4_9FLAO|nr:hypothetical protein [Gramella sp. AN32]
MNYNSSKKTEELDSIYLEYKYEIDNDLSYKRKDFFDQELRKFMSDSFKITLGGPIQTILTGSLGFIFLIGRREKIRKYQIKLIDWLAVFLSLFWLREVFNLVHSISFKVLFQDASYFGGDEKYISEYLKLNSGTIPVILGLIGLGISVYVIFKILPRDVQLPFIISGFIGGITGFFLWFQILGPILIP